MLVFIVGGYLFVAFALWNAQTIDQAYPDIAKLVDTMALRLEADSEEEALANRLAQVKMTTETLARQLELEKSILQTFSCVPGEGNLPSLANPDASRRYTRKLAVAAS